MKKYYLIFIALFTFSSLCGQGNRREVIAAEKAAFFTRILALTSDEAQTFWPLYNEYSDKRDKLVQEKNEITRKVGRTYRNMTDKDLEESGDRLISLIMKEAELKAEYHERFKEVLPASKVVLLYHAENRFTNYLLNQLRSRRENAEGNVRSKL